MIWLSSIALFIAIWHEINRFPAANKSIINLQDKIDNLESENSDLKERIDYLDELVESISTDLDKIKNPNVHQAIEDHDGISLFEIEKDQN